jgi:murein DD-endopeptidase MepM/ murein hydrolase activator NlpD
MLLLGIYSVSHGQTVDELKIKIDNTNTAIEKLDIEIKKYQEEIDSLAKDKDSLSGAIKSLDISKKKLEAETKVTENKIVSKNFEIKELSLQIGDKNERIVDSKRAIGQSLYNISQMNSSSIVEILLSKKSIAEIWNSSDQLDTLQENMQDKILSLAKLKTNLEKNKKLTEQKKAELVVLTNELKSKTKIIADTAKEKNNILVETKNTEANYKKLLATRLAQKEAFEREVADFESALKIAIDPNSIPATLSKVLRYPVDKVIITQYFGNTEFATKNSQLYNGKGHTGIDFGVSIGTPIKSAMVGTVVGTGNTDLTRGCLSYGKWIMVKHLNGLSTLYGHLSLINVTNGQTVSTGEIIGYSGNTGYSTGPHLHFGVYATEGVRITKMVNSKNCTGVTIPLADYKAYLNPLSYL